MLGNLATKRRAYDSVFSSMGTCKLPHTKVVLQSNRSLEVWST